MQILVLNGGMKNIVTLENIVNTRYSRNPQIARVLSEFGWVKEMNEGVKRIYSEMQSLFLKDPVYSEPNHQVLLRLENNILNRHVRIAESLRDKLSPKIFKDLNENERLILQYVMVSGRITKARAVELTSKSRATIQKILKRMEDSGLLIWHGNNRNDPTQYYTLE